MVSAKVFATHEERFLEIVKLINSEDYNTICLISVSPFVLNLYAKRFEELIEERKLPAHLQYAEIRCLIDRKNVEAYNDRMFALYWDRVRQEIHGFPFMPYIILTQPCPGSNLFEPSPLGVDLFLLEVRRRKFETLQKPSYLLNTEIKVERKIALFELDVTSIRIIDSVTQLIESANRVRGDFYWFVCLDDYRLIDRRKKALMTAASSEDIARILYEIGREIARGIDR